MPRSRVPTFRHAMARGGRRWMPPPASMCSRTSARTISAGLLDNTARTAIHMGHRIGALLVFLAVGSLAMRLARDRVCEAIGNRGCGTAADSDRARHHERRVDVAAAGRDRPQRHRRALVARGHYSKLSLLPIRGPPMSELAAPIARATWRDFLEMCKPRVVLLMLLCAVVGMFLATPGMVPIGALVFGTLGIALVAASAAVVNHIADAEIDARMARTHDRPVATGRVTAKQGFVVLRGDGHRGTVRALRTGQSADGLAESRVVVRLWHRLHAVSEAGDTAEHRHRRVCSAQRHRCSVGRL